VLAEGTLSSSVASIDAVLCAAGGAVMSRVRARVLCGIAVGSAVSCSSAPPPPEGPQPAQVQPTADQAAVSLGLAIDARDERGAPRLIRAIVPRRAVAGMTPEQAARDHLDALAPLWIQRGRASERSTLHVQRLHNGASIVRVQQQVDGVDIHHGELRVLLDADGSLAAVSGTMRPDPGAVAFGSTASAALEAALDALYGASRARPAVREGAELAGQVALTVAANPAFDVRVARAKRELWPDGDQLVRVWTVELLAEAIGAGGAVESAGRRTLIADDDRRVVLDVDLVAADSFVYRAFADATGTRNPLDGPLQSFTPHPTGMPDGSLPDVGPYNLVVMEAFNGPRDPWLGPMATTTSGNNVDAFADVAPPSGFNAGDIRPVVRAGRVLDHVYDLGAEPLATPSQSMAAAVNVFFVTNWLHDWYYDSGFTEVTGNAQVDNFGRGGVPGDPLIAHAQSNALAGARDNASMFTPADGLSPEMRMLLWRGRIDTALTTPTGALTCAGFEGGPRSFDVTAVAALATNADGRHTACAPITSDVAGKIAVFDEDVGCPDEVAQANAKAAGAIAVVVRSVFPGPPSIDVGRPSDLPGVVVGNEDGAALEATLPVTVALHRATAVEHDGDLDNALVAHEWGHYLHHRLAPCERGPCSGMSEGWGDFIALHMMLRETDDRAGTFGVNLYALAAGGLVQQGSLRDAGYFGIRRFPYSIDRTKNALRFRHISDGEPLPDVPTNTALTRGPNSETHNAGEVWATMMWEAYNVLLDAHSYADARRRMSDYVVTGLLLTPPDATFTEARDAILAAASALDRDDMLLIAAAFAGRGAGTCAVSPDRRALGNIGVVESGTLAARLQTSGLRVTDDGASCDHDGYLDPGESGTLRVTLANSGVVAAEGVAVQATTTTPGVTLGAPIALAGVAPLTHVELAIPVTLSPSAPVGATLDVALHVTGDAGCNTRALRVELHTPIGVDEQAAVATTDNLETSIVAWTPTGDPGWGRATDEVGNHVLFGSDAAVVSDTQLVSPVLQVSPSEPLVITWMHAYALQGIGPPLQLALDGGVIELSTDGGASWRDVTELGADPGYNGTVRANNGNPLAGRRAFTATNPSFPRRDPLRLSFGTRLAGQAVQLRLRIGTDLSNHATGWQIDDVAVTGITNTPFPGIVVEPTRCVAQARP
jgi:hypothetical protein